LLEGREGRIDLPASKRCPSFVYANAGEAGYYRVRPERGDLAATAGRALARLSEAERFGLLGNAWAAVWSGDLPPPSYLAMLPNLRKETSRLVWRQIIDALIETDIALVPDAAQTTFAAWVREILSPAAHSLGWKDKPGDPDDRKMLRQNVLVALGRLGEDPATLAEAKRIAERWLANQAEVDGDLARVALQVAAKNGDSELFDRLVAVLKNPKTPEIRGLALRALTSFDGRELALRAFALAGDGTLKGQDFFNLLMPLSRRKQTAPVVFEWLEQHIDEVAKTAPSFVLEKVLPQLTTSLCKEERVRAVDAALRPHLEKAGAGVKALDAAIETGLRCATLAAREAAATEAWLRASSAQ
jgi:aminopeptidase N